MGVKEEHTVTYLTVRVPVGHHTGREMTFSSQQDEDKNSLVEVQWLKTKPPLQETGDYPSCLKRLSSKVLPTLTI